MASTLSAKLGHLATEEVHAGRIAFVPVPDGHLQSVQPQNLYYPVVGQHRYTRNLYTDYGHRCSGTADSVWIEIHPLTPGRGKLTLPGGLRIRPA